MKSLRKIFITILSLSVFSLILGTSFAQDFFYEQANPTSDNIEEQIQISNTIKDDSINNDNSILGDIRSLLGLDTYKDSPRPALAYAQMIVNLVLGLVSLIALIIVIFAFYQIFFNKGEEGVTKAKKMLSGVAIALAIMGLSWIIVSFIFYLYTSQTVQ